MGDLADYYDEICERAIAESVAVQRRYNAMSLDEFIGEMIEWQLTIGNQTIFDMLKFYKKQGYLTDKQRHYAASIMAEAVL